MVIDVMWGLRVSLRELWGRAGSTWGSAQHGDPQNTEYPTFSEGARPPAVTEVKGWICLQAQVLSRIERLLKNCILREND